MLKNGQDFLFFELSAAYKRCLYEQVSFHLLKKPLKELSLTLGILQFFLLKLLNNFMFGKSTITPNKEGFPMKISKKDDQIKLSFLI